MEELREKLYTLISQAGTADKEVLEVSQKLDVCILNYYRDNLKRNCRQTM